MTDKQIIIDNVDVSGCEYIDKDSCCNLFEGFIGTPCSSYHFRNCHYKQLKRKEQECERLKEQIKKHNDDMFKNPPEKRFYCKGCTLPYISKKFKATLTEIKEIAETISLPMGTGKSSNRVILAKQILQKISEVDNG